MELDAIEVRRIDCQGSRVGKAFNGVGNIFLRHRTGYLVLTAATVKLHLLPLGDAPLKGLRRSDCLD